MQIKNLMSEDLITIDKDQNLSDALKLLRKHNVSRLPVTNNKELVGIISERDIANKLGSSKYESMPASRLHVSSVMVKDVFTVPQTMQLDDVAKLMLENGIGSVPVMDDGKMVGIVSKADFVTLAVGIAFEKYFVKELMSKELTVVSPSERLVHARRQMIESKVGRLPVVEDEELKGMVTSKDLMRAFIDFRKNNNVPLKFNQIIPAKYITYHCTYIYMACHLLFQSFYFMFNIIAFRITLQNFFINCKFLFIKLNAFILTAFC